MAKGKQGNVPVLVHIKTQLSFPELLTFIINGMKEIIVMAVTLYLLSMRKMQKV
jgi:hypothetical protein